VGPTQPPQLTPVDLEEEVKVLESALGLSSRAIDREAIMEEIVVSGNETFVQERKAGEVFDERKAKYDALTQLIRCLYG